MPFGVTDFKVRRAVGTYSEQLDRPTSGRRPTSAPTWRRVSPPTPLQLKRASIAEFGERSPLASEGLFSAPGAECEESEIGTQEATIYTGKYPTEGFGDVPVSGTVYDLVPAAKRTHGQRVRPCCPLRRRGRTPQVPHRSRAQSGLRRSRRKRRETRPGWLPERSEQEFLEAQQYYSHSLIKGSVEWGKEARGTGSRRLPRLLRNRSGSPRLRCCARASSLKARTAMGRSSRTRRAARAT